MKRYAYFVFNPNEKKVDFFIFYVKIKTIKVILPNFLGANHGADYSHLFWGERQFAFI